MILYTFAHWGEAQVFIQELSAKKTVHLNGELYEAQDALLLLTGEGLDEAMSKTSFVLGLFPSITSILNFGVAGSLKDFSLKQIFSVRTVYQFFGETPRFKSFTSDDSEGVDVITSSDRILKEASAALLRPHGDLVDRELWGIAFAAKTKNISWRSFKIVSDKAGTLGACEVAKDQAMEFSQLLFEKSQTLSPAKVTVPFQHAFYMTVAQERLLKKAQEKLIIKWGEEIFKAWREKHEQEIALIKTVPKEKTKRLLSLYQDALTPWRKKAEEKKDQLFSPLKSRGIEIQTDPQWEVAELDIRFKMNPENHQEKIRALQNLPWEKYQELLNGASHVE